MNRIVTLFCFTLSLLMTVLFSGTDASYSCLGITSNYEKYRISYVDPQLFSDSTYQSFYRIILQEHQAASTDGDTPFEEFCQPDGSLERVRERENILDWSRYFKNTIPLQSIHDLIYRSDTDMIDGALNAIVGGRKPAIRDSIIPAPSEREKPDTLHFAAALRVIVQRNDRAFLRYLHYANKCSPHAGTGNDGWNDPEETADPLLIDSLIQEGLILHKTFRSDFLRLRCAYQLVRLARYSGNYGQAIQFYDSLVAPNTDRSPIRFWALGHKGGSARKMGDRPLSNYYFSQVFDSCEGEREIALRDLDVRSQAEWDALYQMARNDHERATIRMMKGLRREGLSFEYIGEMYALEPTSPRLAIALLRELHRIESYFYDGLETRKNTIPLPRSLPYRRQWDSLIYYEALEPVTDTATKRMGRTVRRAISGRDYMAAFRSFVLKIAAEGKVSEPALLYMTAGYLDMMDNDWEMADECLLEAGRTVAGNRELGRQIELLSRLKEIKSRKKRVDEGLEADINETLRWFREKQFQNRHTKYDKVMAALGQSYLLQEDVPKAILAFNAAHDSLTRNILLDMYASQGDLQILQELVERGGKTDFERLLIDSFPFRRPDLLDLRGTRLLRQGEFRKGLDLFRQIPSSYWDILPSPNEYGYTPDNFRKFRSSTERASEGGLSLIANEFRYKYMQERTVEKKDDIHHYTKLSFAQTAVALLDRAERTGRGGADSAHYRLARLLYNTPYWGYADGLWRGELLMEMRFYYRGPDGYPFNIPELAHKVGKAQEEFLAEYGSRRLAGEYYRRAMKETQDRELAATCAYMMDLCANWPLTSLHPVPNIKERDRTGYNLLLTKYRDTYFAESVLSTCSIYQRFATQRK